MDSPNFCLYLDQSLHNLEISFRATVEMIYLANTESSLLVGFRKPSLPIWTKCIVQKVLRHGQSTAASVPFSKPN